MLKSNPEKRVSTRTTGHLVEYPKLVYDVLERISKAVDYGNAEVVDHQGKDGVFVIVTVTIIL